MANELCNFVRSSLARALSASSLMPLDDYAPGAACRRPGGAHSASANSRARTTLTRFAKALGTLVRPRTHRRTSRPKGMQNAAEKMLHNSVCRPANCCVAGAKVGFVLIYQTRQILCATKPMFDHKKFSRSTTNTWRPELTCALMCTISAPKHRTLSHAAPYVRQRQLAPPIRSVPRCAIRLQKHKGTHQVSFPYSAAYSSHATPAIVHNSGRPDPANNIGPQEW